MRTFRFTRALLIPALAATPFFSPPTPGRAQTAAGAPSNKSPTARHPDAHDAHRDRAPHPETITVNARAAPGTRAQYSKPDVTLGPLGTRDEIDTPFSIMSVTRDVIANQQSRAINDLVQYLPSAQLEERGDPSVSRPQSRGFEADVAANSRMDGLNMIITTPYATEMFDNLELLNGLSGALYGPQNPAGTFSFTLKRPTDQRVVRLKAGVDSIGAPLEAVDVSGRYHWFGYRLNMLNQTGESFVADSHLRRDLLSGDFDIHLDDNTVIQIDAAHYVYAQRGYPGGFSYAPGVTLPSAPDLSNKNWSQPYAGFNAETNTALTKIIHHFNKNWSVTFGGLYENAYRRSFQVTNTVLDDIGTYRANIRAATSAKNFKLGSNLAYLNGRFRTGPLRHEIVLGSNGYVMSNFNPTQGQNIVLGTGNFSNPTRFSGEQPYYSGTYKSAVTTVQTLMAGDTIWFNPHWAIMGTLAWAWIGENNYNSANVKTSSYQKNGAFTPMTSLMYKPTENQTAYFTWGQSIQAGPIAPISSKNAYTALAPLTSEEYEIGYKYRFRNGLQLNVAAFRMTRAYAFTNPTTDIYAIAGTQRNYGVEFQASGAVTPWLSVLGGMTWMDAQVGNSGDATTSHKQVVGVPPVQANILLDYHPDWANGAAVNASVHYMGRRAADVENASFVDGFTTLDLGARYATRVYDAPIVFRFGVNNVTDAQYWASVYPSSENGSATATNTAVAGYPRTYHFTMELSF